MGALFSINIADNLVSSTVRELESSYILFKVPNFDNTFSANKYFCKDANMAAIKTALSSYINNIKDCHDDYPLCGKLSSREKGIKIEVSNDLEITQGSLSIIAGLNAVDNYENVEKTLSFLNSKGLKCARMGAYKPRTSPYSFQGAQNNCLENVLSLADKYQFDLIAMEVRDRAELDEVLNAHAKGGYRTKILLQVGTRNAQNFELLKAVGAQTEMPVLYKRGFGITLEESMSACEYLAASGNSNIIFCLRGIKSLNQHEHRNMCDFSQVGIIKRNLKLPVCIDPSHSVGNKSLLDEHLISDIANTTAQGIVAGANAILLDIHPSPEAALVDAKQALNFMETSKLLEDIKITRELYLRRLGIYEANTELTAMSTY